MQLSIVDVVQVMVGRTPVDALAASVRLAGLADRLGYTRYWVNEHHGAAAISASSMPEILISRIAGETTGIRVGSGAVLLNHQSAFRVAESFRLLHSLAPGRIDLGIGRASGGKALDRALQRDRARPTPRDDYPDQVDELLTWLNRGFPKDHEFGSIALYADVPGNPEPWLLGSSPNSGVLAGERGLPYCFAAFLNPGAAHETIRTYRAAFRPSRLGTGIDRPYVILALNACTAPTEAEASRVRSSVEMSNRGRRGALVPADESVAALGNLPEPTQYTPGEWPRAISAAPQRLRDMLIATAKEVDADELMLQDLVADPTERSLSYQLIAKAFELPARPLAAPAVAGSDLRPPVAATA